MSTDFIDGILFEDNMFMYEEPDEIRVYDLDGREIEI